MKLQKSYISDVQLGKNLVIGMKINGRTLYNKSGPWSTSFTVDGLADRDMPIFNKDFGYDVTRNGYYDNNDLFHGNITISAKVENSYPYTISFRGTWGNADAITSIDRIDYIDTNYIDYDWIDISFMNCRNVTSIDTSQLEKVDFAIPSGGTTANEFNIFANCYALRKLNVRRLDVSGMTDMSAMFRNCNSLTALDLSDWDVSNVGTMSYMFRNCNSLTSIGDLSKWDTSKVYGSGGFKYMFYGCSSLEELDLSSFVVNPEELQGSSLSLEGMFGDCTSLRKLDLSNFVTTEDIPYTFIRNTFSNCNNLRELRLDNCCHKFINDILSTTFDGKLPDNIIEGVTKTIYCKKSESEDKGLQAPDPWVFSFVPED